MARVRLEAAEFPVELPDDLPGDRVRDPVILSDEEYERLLAECQKRSWMLYPYGLTCGETGAQCESEVLCGSGGRT